MTNADQKIDKLPDCAVLTKTQVSVITGLSRDTLDRLHRQNQGPPRVRLSERRVGYPLSQIRAWLKQRQESAA